MNGRSTWKVFVEFEVEDFFKYLINLLGSSSRFNISFDFVIPTSFITISSNLRTTDKEHIPYFNALDNNLDPECLYFK